jgi:hypothetical protein
MGFWHVQVEMILQALEYETGEFVFKTQVIFFVEMVARWIMLV